MKPPIAFACTNDALRQKAAAEVATWRRRYPGLAGVDIDAENVVEQSDPAAMAAFVTALKSADPGILVSLCVYGNPEGRRLHNFLVNSLLTNATVDGIDFINIMGYGGLAQNKKFAEEYTHAPRSKWDHPIDAAVPAGRVVMGIKAASALGSCDPPDGMPFEFILLDNDARGMATRIGTAEIDGLAVDHYQHIRVSPLRSLLLLVIYGLIGG